MSYTPDPNTTYSMNDPAIDAYVNGDDTTANDQGTDTTGATDIGSTLGAAAAGIDFGGDNQNKTGGANGVPNPGSDAATVGPAGMPNQATANTQAGLFASEPSQQAAAQGAPGFFTGGGGGATPSIPNPGLTDQTPAQPQGSQLLAAGPGWAIDSTGRFSSTNTPDYVRANQGWEGGYVGPGTIVQTKDIQTAGYDPATGTFHEGFNGNQDRGFRSFGGLAPNGQPYGGPMGFGSQWDPITAQQAQQRGVDFSQFGPQPLVGGAWGGWQPGGVAYGPGVNMEAGSSSRYGQMTYNGGLGAPPAGGAAAYGNPAYTALFSDNPRPLNAPVGGGSYGGGSPITGVMNPDSTFMSPAGAVMAAGGAPGTNRTGAPGGAAATTGNPLQDQGHILRNPDGSIVGVASPNGSYDARFQSYDNILRNAQNGDPFALRDAQVLAKAGDANAKAVVDTIAGLPDFAKSQLAAGWDQAHNAQIQGRIGTEFANNRAAAANLAGQAVSNIPQNPTSNFDALLGGDAHAQAVQALTAMGASNVKIAPDPTGKLQLTWDSKNGNQNSIPFTLTNSGALVAALQGDAGARQQITSQNTGGRAPSGGRSLGGGRSYGGYSGGGTTRTTASAPAASSPPQTFPVPAIGGSGNAAEMG